MPHYVLHLIYVLILVLESFEGDSIALGTMIECLHKESCGRCGRYMKEHQLLQRWVQVRLLVAGAIFVYLVPYKIRGI